MIEHPIATPLLHSLACSCDVSVSTQLWIVAGENSFRFWQFCFLICEVYVNFFVSWNSYPRFTYSIPFFNGPIDNFNIAND